MSEIKEKLENIGLGLHQMEQICKVIESNYIPLKASEQLRLADTLAISRGAINYVKENQKLKEENERLRYEVLASIETKDGIIKAVKELLRLQRENCAQAFMDNGKGYVKAILNAPEPSIEDLNKG